MGSTRLKIREPESSAPAAAEGEDSIDREDSIESLRQAFHAKLESERVHFVTLSAALACADENPLWIFEDLEHRAHRLRGGAAIFEESEVAMAAGRLENAAMLAAQSRAENTDENVWSALEALVKLMGRIESVRAAARV
jgi:HPt (histidine-containing phosphotransfer) domain-containing protein